jgi:hypothetical protein
MRRKKIIPESPQTVFGSLAELLTNIKNMPLNDAYRIAYQEYALTRERIEWIQEFLKVRAEKKFPNLIDYSWEINLLLSTMEGKYVNPSLGSKYGRGLIADAMSNWRSNTMPIATA